MTRPWTAILGALCALALAHPGAAVAKGTPQGFFGVVPQEPLSAGDYRSLVEGGVRTARISFNWAGVQYVKGKCKPEPAIATCNWSLLDETVGNLATVGVRALPILSGTPGFVSNKRGNKPPTGRRDMGRWKAFVKAAAKRYGRGGAFWQENHEYGPNPLPIHDWQVWNEPNASQFWHPKPQPKKYARLVKASGKMLRKGDRKANVVLGGMFAEAKMPIGAFLRRFYRAKKVERAFDAVAVHPYAPSIGGLKRQLRATRSAVRRAGDGKTGTWVTELGWSSGKGSHPLSKGKSGQAKRLKKAFRLLKARRKRWNVEGVTWFALRDTDNRDTCQFCRKSGLFNVSGKPKPSWRAFLKVSR